MSPLFERILLMPPWQSVVVIATYPTSVHAFLRVGSPLFPVKTTWALDSCYFTTCYDLGCGHKENTKTQRLKTGHPSSKKGI